MKKRMNKWIPVEERLPEEQDSIFAQLYGTEKWNDVMFRKTSDEVLVTYLASAKLNVTLTGTAHTNDGEWKSDVIRTLGYKVIAWMKYPDPYEPGGQK
jgi:hypothetical protein